MAITRSTPLAAQQSRTASQSLISCSGVSVGRCFQPRKSFPAPFSDARTSKASRAFFTEFSYLAASTKEKQPLTSTFTILFNYSFTVNAIDLCKSKPLQFQCTYTLPTPGLRPVTLIPELPADAETTPSELFSTEYLPPALGL